MSQGGRVVVVAQAFKESLSLAEVAAALERATRATGLEPVVIKGSDGGDGLLDAMENDLRQRTTHRVSGPAARQVDVEAGWLDPTTVLVESRLACGLSLLAPGERDPRRTTTRGVGELLVAVEAAGARQMVVGLGGSATMDGGTGMARAWGWEFLDEHGRPLGEGGGDLERLARILPGRSPAAGLTALVDVRHPLTGPEGAVIFAEQKGASPDAA
ncbi:MAG TPA: glycerate kinase, partial [Gemmatimonadales bacterium]|nr:glycerate kinase [Gemmatimonadales bacterium]